MDLGQSTVVEQHKEEYQTPEQTKISEQEGAKADQAPEETKETALS